MVDIPNRDLNEVWEGMYLSLLECRENILQIHLICRGQILPSVVSLEPMTGQDEAVCAAVNFKGL